MRFNKIYSAAGALFLWIGTVSAAGVQQAQEPAIQEQAIIASSVVGDFPREIFRVEGTRIVPFDIVEEEHPANDLYEIWLNKEVNPYKIAIKDLDDFFLDLTGYVHPVEEGPVTSHYGPRRGRFHHGIDLRVKVGQSIYAAFDGKVRVTGFDRYGYGYYVVIRHNNGLETLYGHLSSIKVEANDDVSAGEEIGLGGNTGRSTGPHLHFEFRYLGNAINPAKLVNFEEKTLLADSYMICKKTTFTELISFQQAKYHIVKSGDTLSSIARRYGTTVSRLCQLNNLKSTSVLRVKQRIRYS